jgi:hypothetical protein
MCAACFPNKPDSIAMTIHPHDHVLRFRFTSDTREDIVHVVDLGEFDGFGECSCEDFGFRLLPVLKRNRNPFTHSSDISDEAGLKRCKHILAARDYLASQVIARICAG